MPLGALPTWVTVALGLFFVVIGIAIGEPVAIVVGPLFLVLGGITYAMEWSAQNRALRTESEAPLGVPPRADALGDEPPADTFEVREGRAAIIAFGLLIAFIGCGAFATYGAEAEALLGVPFIVGGALFALMAARKRIEASAGGLRFVGFRPWTVHLAWADTRAVGRGLARRGGGFRDPLFSAFAVNARGEKRPLPLPLSEERAFAWVVRQAEARGLEVPEAPPR